MTAPVSLIIDENEIGDYRARRVFQACRHFAQTLAPRCDIMADYIDPEGGLTREDVVQRMLELFDNPTAIEAYEREMTRRAGGRDARRWH